MGKQKIDMNEDAARLFADLLRKSKSMKALVNIKCCL